MAMMMEDSIEIEPWMEPVESSSSDEEDLIQRHLDSDDDADFYTDDDPDYQIPPDESTDDDDDDDDDDEDERTPRRPAHGRRSGAASAPPTPPPTAPATPPPTTPRTPTTSRTPSRPRSPPTPPLTSPKRRRTEHAARKAEEEGRRWHNREEEDRRPDPLRFCPARNPGPTIDTTATWTPLSLFQLFFSTSVIKTIIDNTNINAKRKIAAGLKLNWKPLTVDDFYIFLAIIIFTGLVHVHRRGDYWRKKWPYCFTFPRNKMSRDRFEAILSALHLSNPKQDMDNDRKKNTPEYDKLFKIKPLYDDIVTACKAHFQPYQNISIDERMVATKTRISIRQYMKNKPTKWGYKLFVLADSATGYTWNFSVYTGKSRKIEGSAAHDVSYSSVVNLLPFSLLGGGYRLYVDNFYTSPALFNDLLEKHIACCGTIRRNLAGFPQSQVNDLPAKPERGDIRWMRKDNLLFLKWLDTRVVTMCSTFHKAFSGQTVKRKVKKEGEWKIKEVPVPDAVLDYNKNMGGVDLSDSLIGYYTVHHKTQKWYKTFFYHFIDVAVVNSFLLHKELCRIKSDPAMKACTQKVFREQLASEMLDGHEAWESPPNTTPKLSCMPRKDPESRRYCRRCQDAGIKRVKTPIYCRNCNVALCLTSTKNCFEQWHDQR